MPLVFSFKNSREKTTFEMVFFRRKPTKIVGTCQFQPIPAASNHSSIGKSSLYFRSVDFLPKNDRYLCSRTVVFIEILSIKKLRAIKLAKIKT